MTLTTRNPGCVFLGPTLALSAAKKILPTARFFPPIQCGDLLRLLHEQPAYIAIIDGAFETTAAVWHKEILLCLEKKYLVYGASSMGALRAAELAQYGMVGVGKIYQAYRDGELNDDDEVAVLHTPAPNYIALTESMVNIRATLAQAVTADILPSAVAVLLAQYAKSLFYKLRTWDKLLALAVERGMDVAILNKLSHWLAGGGRVDHKQEDAVALLRHIQHATISADHGGIEHSLLVPRTVYLRAMLRAVTSGDSFTKALASLLAAMDSLAIAKQMPLGHDEQTVEPTPWLARLCRIQALLQINTSSHWPQDITRHLSYFSILYHWKAEPNSPQFYLLRIMAMLWLVLVREMVERDLIPQQAVIEHYSVQFRRQHQLLTQAALQDWLAKHDFSLADYHRLLEFSACFSFLIIEGHLDSVGVFHYQEEVPWVDAAVQFLTATVRVDI
ncbi:MAG: hypothetical protein A3J38_05315 [Gammaproteobacteria bacterium RIFCSPHIGHO2_12_FULL_45_9]|nr:MAG: hypothetical protein A3J38_05315 [Gammaproteobacteria bacterium RIFCSPHIGHO2_12_FULL_45_9]